MISRDRGLDDRERLQPEEVELDEPGLLDVLHRELGDDLAVLAAEARHVLPQRALGDHDAGGVHAGVAVQALERRRDVEQLAVHRALGVELLELGLLLDRLAHRRALALHRLGHQLGELVRLGERDLHHARDVADHAARLELVERRDLADPVDRRTCSWTYLITSSRRFMQKSTSKSGIDTRSGLRNRSNSSLNWIGSRSVIRSDYATGEPAPEPRPGPTGMPAPSPS